MAMENLITNRTIEDVNYVVELGNKVSQGTATQEEIDIFKRENLKGAYNASDLNRVTQAVNYLAGLLKEHGYYADVEEISIIHKVPMSNGSFGTRVDTTWIDPYDIPNESHLETYLNNVRKIRNAITVLPTTPQLPFSMSRLNYVGANNIEKVLEDVEFALNKSLQFKIYSGEVFSGEV